jgi:serine/threonine-protein kinase HipA
MKQLDVFTGDVLIGHLRERDDGALLFAYLPEWVASGKAGPLSPDLPLEGEHSGDAVVAYFDNLLPEGSVRDFIAQAEHISPNNVFGLLERFGGDTAGALSLLPHGQTPSSEPHYLPVTQESIREWFVNSRGIPLNLAGEQARMSLSGAQDKMTVYIDSHGSIALPLGAAPSSHIIKPSMGYRSQVPQTAVNEALVMTLAAAIKLDVPTVRYSPELDAVLIQRYDRREREDGRLTRLHQNDLCQIMGVSSKLKYEAEGGPSIKDCFAAVMERSSQPALDKKRLIEWVVFNLAVGNMDSHAKNLSVLEVEGNTRLAPFYDMVCTTVYPNLSRRFAFKVGGDNRPGWIMDRHWEQFANEIDTKPQFVNKIRQDISNRIGNALPQVANTLRDIVVHPDGLVMIDRVEAEVRRATGQLRGRLAAGTGTQLQPPDSPNSNNPPMQFDSYKAITATAQTQADFLHTTRQNYASDSRPGEALHEFMARSIEVNGKPFSQVRHLTALEEDSYDWDLDAAPAALRRTLAADARALYAADHGYNLPHFMTGFEAMVQHLQPEPPAGVDRQPTVKPPSPDDKAPDAGPSL